ncbi:ABC-type transport auxiliary lipoprotein family protein [Oceanibaculum pacificum]|uniref:ABC-type transport auxiliary lipoprotein family protein n=1 Tax=Oceanibaculum pacificum TaxID=580166 RepID=UPI0009FBEC08|nr:ABC-type transport auxiliary lipoprotein family protein [Oceanibaculum pacificum]
MTRLTISRRTALAGLGLGTMLASTGCTPLAAVRGEPTRLFQLHPAKEFAADLPRLTQQITIEEPEAAAGLSSSRIALTRHPLRLEYFAQANWTDTTPGLIQTLLVESFENTGKIISIGREVVGLRADYQLKTELREFQAEYFNEAKIPTIRVRMNAKLVRMPQRIILDSGNFEYTALAASDQLIDVAAAFDTALMSALRALVEWTMRIVDSVDRDITTRRR